jgi:superfamily II DNA/RNA helicase
VWIVRSHILLRFARPFVCSDLIKRRELSLAQIKVIVLDWAEELLSSGSKDQLDDVFKTHLPRNAQVCLFSVAVSGT